MVMEGMSSHCLGVSWVSVSFIISKTNSFALMDNAFRRAFEEVIHTVGRHAGVALKLSQSLFPNTLVPGQDF